MLELKGISAAYGAVRAFAQRLGHPEIAQILQKTLDEEGEANKHLIQLAEAGINSAATSTYNA